MGLHLAVHSASVPGSRSRRAALLRSGPTPLVTHSHFFASAGFKKHIYPHLPHSDALHVVHLLIQTLSHLGWVVFRDV